jgi:dipeptidyl aminopeptidase/acylaminoacyl peptidase
MRWPDLNKALSDFERVEFTSEDQRLVGVLHLPRRGRMGGSGIVITCHGLMSSKDSQKYLEIAKLLSSTGFAVLRFDFRGSGESEGSGDLLSKRIMDLKAALKFAQDKGYRSVGLIGSSYGGTTAILVASETTEIKCLVTWSTPCKLIELFDGFDTQGAMGQSGGSQETESVRSSQFKEDLARYDVAEAAKRVAKILVIHCKGDKVVSWNQAKIIYENAKKPKSLKVFEKGDHQLIDSSIRKEALALTIDWLTKYMK